MRERGRVVVRSTCLSINELPQFSGRGTRFSDSITSELMPGGKHPSKIVKEKGVVTFSRFRGFKPEVSVRKAS